jgi:hypothetical protein
MKFFYFILLAIMIGNSYCNDLDLSTKVGRQTVSISQGSLYFYRITRGLSTDACFLSMKENICMGLKKNEDFYFMVLDPTIYYEIGKDTLFIYTSLPANPPDKFGFNVVQIELSNQESEKYEQLFREGKIKKVLIDSTYSTNCEVKY